MPSLMPQTAFMPLFPAPQTADTLRAQHGERYPWLVLLVMALGIISAVLCTTSFAVAIPAMMQRYGIGQEQAQWTMTGFMAAMAVGMLPAPWLLERIGFRKLFLGSSALLLASSLAGALGASWMGFSGIVVVRILQGVAAGVMQPLGTLAVMRLFQPHEQGRASGILGFGIVLAPAVAPSLGGMLLDMFSWSAIFWLGVPTGVAALWLAARWLPLPREITRRSFDWIGVLLLTGATLAMIEGISSLQHSGLLAPGTLLLSAAAVILLGLFVLHARRIEHPIIRLELFQQARFSMSVVVFFAYGFGIYASSYLIPVFMLQALHYSATAAGTALVPSGIVLALVIPVAGRMADKYSPLLVTAIGLALFFASSVMLAVFATHISYSEIVFATIVGRFGLGMILPALSVAALRTLQPAQMSQASVVTSYARQLGGVLGIAMAAVFVAWREMAYQGQPDGVAHAYGDGFLLVAGMYLVALLAAWFMRGGRKPAC